uniref:Uncharacterized protein n=1 Tax=Avena sativa TaxID=4498 RepID=A0ACD5TZM6_AVESA
MAGIEALLHLVATMLLVLVTAIIASPNCASRCGNISIPYPFGLIAGCHREGFKLDCNDNTYNPPKLFMNSSGIQVLEISAQDSTLWIDSGILTLDGNQDIDGFIRMNWSIPLDYSLYKVSSGTNVVVFLGCGINAIVQWHTPGGDSASNCVPECVPGHPVVATDGTCSGIGCCSTRNVGFNSNMFLIKYTVEEDNLTVNSSLALVEEKWWSQKKNVMALQQAVSSDNTSLLGVSDGVLHNIPGAPVRTAISWVFSNLTCGEAINSSDFGCLSDNSECIDHLEPDAGSTGGYTCRCWRGYEGNPYERHGCQGFATVIGIGSGLGILLIILVVLFLRKNIIAWKAKKSRAFFFKQNRGLLLQRLVDKDIAERMIFSLEELEKATNRFDMARKLGGGGHSTVYKGILSDQRVVAIKKSKVVIQRETDDFINEVVILSQVNHRNVVKLFGCCLETEVPLLVYEFVSNGTLSDHLHVSTPLSLPWKDRLRIALETSRCLAYLHSAASVSIVHRDIKSANILLDDRLTSKVSDFGASRGIPIDQTGVTTAVQGTFGYLDPEYYHTRRLTERSDVYSFGVVLVELLTRKKPCVHMSSPGASLTAEFTLRVNQEKLFEMLDQQVIEEGGEEAKELAVVAVMCLNLKGEDRPTMRQVETRLEAMQTMANYTPVEQNHANPDDDNFSRQYSMEEEYMSSMDFPR